MPIIHAELTLAFIGGPKFLKWQPKKRRALEDAVHRSIDRAVSEAARIRWISLDLDVDAHGGIADAKLCQRIMEALEETETDRARKWVVSLANDGQAVPVQVARAYTVERQRHEYFYYMARKKRSARHNPKLWVTGKRHGEEVQVAARISWETPVPS